jgi:hypothetical protein
MRELTIKNLKKKKDRNKHEENGKNSRQLIISLIR